MDNLDMTTRNTQIITLEGRVGKLEGTMETLAQEVRTTNQNVQKVSDNFSIFREELLSKIGVISTPKWPIIFSIATLVTTILGLGGVLITIMVSGQKEILRTHDVELAALHQNIDMDKIENGKDKVRVEGLIDLLKEEHKNTKEFINDLTQWRLNNVIQNSANMTKIDYIEKKIDKLENRQYKRYIYDEQNIIDPPRSKTTH